MKEKAGEEDEGMAKEKAGATDSERETGRMALRET